MSSSVKMIILLISALVIVKHSLSLQFDITGRLGDIVPSEGNKRIIKGESCFVESHPYMVSMRLVKRMAHFCGGTILSRKSVLTAAHCVFDFVDEPRHIVAVAGLTDESTTIQIRQVNKIHIPPSYSTAMMVGDVSVLRVEHSFDFSDVVQPVSLSPWHPTDVTKFCTKGLIIGWGSTVPRGPRTRVEFREMMCAEVPVISYSQCQKYVNLFMDRSKFCAMGEGEDACLGDSGGPMMCGGVQIGVISSGNGCGAKNSPGVYARVDYHLNYITRMMSGQRRPSNMGVIVVMLTVTLCRIIEIN